VKPVISVVDQALLSAAFENTYFKFVFHNSKIFKKWRPAASAAHHSTKHEVDRMTHSGDIAIRNFPK